MKFQKNVSLKKYTTFQIGGKANYFFIAKKKEDLIKAIKTAKKQNLPFFILGGGSNILISDKGYKGLVIKIRNSPKESLRLPTGQAKFKTIYVESGIRLGELVNASAEAGLTGLEWAAGIPGTVGGAIHGNAGAFGGSMADMVKKVEVLQVSGFRFQVLSFRNKDCKFGYRDSIFKKNPNLIILSCKLQLRKGDKRKIKEKIKEYLDYRRARHPQEPSAGCIFKNASPSAGELIEKCGLKGEKIGGAKISEKHPNFIVNTNGAQAEDVFKLIKLIKKKVKEKFGILLEEEIQFLGFPH